MRMPKTIKGYINLIKKIEKEIIPSKLKGFDKLTKEQKEQIYYLDADISNNINEIN